jgi:hypothetical protein
MLTDPPSEEPQLIKASIFFGFARLKRLFLKYSKSFGHSSLPPGKTKRESPDSWAIVAISAQNPFEEPVCMEARTNPILFIDLQDKKDLLPKLQKGQATIPQHIST